MCNICQQLNISSVFANKESCGLNMLFNTNVMELNSKEWKSELEKKTKLRTYVKFKDNYEQEYYVNTILSSSISVWYN